MSSEEFLNMKITELEKKTGINRGTLSKYFSLQNPETPSWKNIMKMSASLGMSAEQVMNSIAEKRRQKLNNLKAIVSNTKINIPQTV